jgi:hypothetical protein
MEAKTRYHMHTQWQKPKCSQQKNMVSDEEEDEKKEECDPTSFLANKRHKLEGKNCKICTHTPYLTLNPQKQSKSSHC